MYRIEDSTSATKEVQRLLGVNETGNYDKKTRDAVLRLQALYALPESGVVDYTTFGIIVKEYRESRSKILSNRYLFDANFPYVEGDVGENVQRINEALAKVLVTYPYHLTVPRGKYFGRDTLSGVRFMQDVFGIEKRDEVDVDFMNRILKELEGIEIKEKHGYK